MRKVFFGTVLFLIFAVISSHAQNKFSGKIVSDNHPVSNATIMLSGNSIPVLRLYSNDSGYFSTDKIPFRHPISIVVVALGKKTYRQTIQYNDNLLVVQLEDADNTLEPLEVRAVRASDKAPFAKSEIAATQIAKLNTGKDLPYILNQTPSIVVNSDAGNGIGYTGIRVRGSDASRTNVTINGIPYNDAESQGAYFVDIPDVASSAQSIQIQRGVGTSTNGAGAFGATININTNEIHEIPYTQINNTYSSFNSWKNTVAAGTGLINQHFYADVRLSHISTDGYIDRAASKLQSLLFSTGYVSDKTSLKFNFITGKEKTYQAWNGIYEGNINDPQYGRRYNELGLKSDGTFYNDQTDNYVQNHYQLFWNQQLSPYMNLNIASFLTRGSGYYQEYKNAAKYTSYGLDPYVPSVGDTIKNTDLIRQRWLDNYFYGQTFALQYKKNTDEFTLGGAWTRYDGKHYGYILWTANGGVPDNYRYYGDLPAHKYDQNIYLKWMHSFAQYWNFFADAQYRHVKHIINGYDDDPTLDVNRNFNFFNPKIGISYIQNGYNAFFSYAMANKEPGRDDFETRTQQPESERLHDFELGISKKEKNYNWGATFYYMNYKNQLVLTGKMNDVGGFTRINVPNSYRAGIELQGSYTFTNWLNANANITFSKNKIKDFTAYYEIYNNADQDIDLGTQQSVAYHNTDISFSPNIVGSAIINVQPIRQLEFSLIGKYVGKQYLDNTEDNSRKINDYYNQDIRAIYMIKTKTFKQIDIVGYVYNAFNKMYYTNGAAYTYWVDGQTQPTNYNYYFPYAGTHYSIGINIGL
ncbi:MULTISPECIES: TonB-dependent receptor [Chitinophagaceae]